SWVRSWIDETYLWYAEVPQLSAASYSTAVDYFAALKTPAKTASGKDKDHYHFTYSTADWVALSRSGVMLGYGIEWQLLSASPPRSIVMAQVAPGSMADRAGLARGATVLSVDGVDLVNGSDVATLNAGLFPVTVGEQHSLVVRDTGSSTARTVTLTAGAMTMVPVQNVKTFDTASGAVGYLLFNDHIATAEGLLVAAVQQLQAANVRDLVLDMRYNGGGYLDIAAELAYMVAGSTRTTDQVFERLTFNDKNPFKLTDADTVTPFYTQSQGFSVPSGQTLPSLGLSRVYVLTSASTCSASESVINGLRGVGVEVNLVGATTCGKPYGFIPKDNCGTTFFAIQFKGVNQLGFGDYSDGFSPACRVSDDFNHALGDPLEGQLAAALRLRTGGVCPAAADTPSAPESPNTASRRLALRLPLNPARSNRTVR
ncbi:MAG: hypothetical protein RLZZ401_1679, partial [Pseudomonadota bacterium]